MQTATTVLMLPLDSRVPKVRIQVLDMKERMDNLQKLVIFQVNRIILWRQTEIQLIE